MALWASARDSVGAFKFRLKIREIRGWMVNKQDVSKVITYQNQPPFHLVGWFLETRYKNWVPEEIQLNFRANKIFQYSTLLRLGPGKLYYLKIHLATRRRILLSALAWPWFWQNCENILLAVPKMLLDKQVGVQIIETHNLLKYLPCHSHSAFNLVGTTKRSYQQMIIVNPYIPSFFYTIFGVSFYYYCSAIDYL
jgi:hypothetical protein